MIKSRLEAFSDGVMAIIITIMVLELKVPEDGSLKSLFHLLPVFISYVLSFLYIGIYWANHHHLLHTVKHINASIIWYNLHFLFWLSLMPFTTAWMGEHHSERITVILYGIDLVLCAFAYYLFQRAISQEHKQDEKMHAAMQKQSRKGNISLLIYLLALPAAFISPLLSQVCYAVVAIMWIVPDRNIEKALSE